MGELLTFSEALDRIKKGDRVGRTGWNGKGMFVFLVPGSTFKVSRPPLLGIYEEGTEINYHGHIDMKTADGQIVPWLCSQTDMLAEDWEVWRNATPLPYVPGGLKMMFKRKGFDLRLRISLSWPFFSFGGNWALVPFPHDSEVAFEAEHIEGTRKACQGILDRHLKRDYQTSQTGPKEE